MSDLPTQSLTTLAALIRAREVSPVEVVQAHLKRIEQFNPMLNAIVTVQPDVMKLARDAEAAIMRGEKIGPLHGVPLTIKDTIETKGLLTTSGSRVRAGYVPQQDANAVARLRNAGAIILGKTNVSEMAAAYDTENPVFGHANNPYDLQRTSGGSSGGEAAAIAACLSPGGLGSDLMGSVRIPAHFCGIVGLKPSAERVPCDGHIPSTNGATRHGAAMGPLARNVEDATLLFRVLSNLDMVESDALQGNARGADKLRGMAVAWHTYDGVTPVTEETQRAVESASRALASAGLEVREEKPPAVEHGHDLWSKLFARSAAWELRAEYRGRDDEAGVLVRFLLESSLDAPTAPLDEFSNAWELRNQLRETLLEWMSETPLIIAPVGATNAFAHGTRKFDIRGETVSVFRAFSYAQTYNVFDLPAVCVPAGVSHDGLPLGVQIIGKPFAEDAILAAGILIERALGGWREPELALSHEADNPL